MDSRQAVSSYDSFDHITIKTLLLDSRDRQTDEHIVLPELLVVKYKLIGVGAITRSSV
jgi:hypothetical protein